MATVTVKLTPGNIEQVRLDWYADHGTDPIETASLSPARRIEHSIDLPAAATHARVVATLLWANGSRKTAASEITL